MRYGARGLRGALMRRMNSERYRRDPVCRQAGGGLQRSGLSVHPTPAVPSAAAASSRIGSRYSILSSSSSSSSSSPVLPCLPVLPELPADIDRRRQVATTAPQGGADIPVCAGRQECLPHTALPPFSSLRGCPATPHSPDPYRPPSTPIESSKLHFPLSPVSCHCLLPLPTATPCLLPLPTATAYCYFLLGALAVQNTFLPSCLPDSKNSRSLRIAHDAARSLPCKSAKSVAKTQSPPPFRK